MAYYTVHGSDDAVMAGDPALDDVLKAEADRLGGYITDEADEIVYDSRGE
jgi:hypothetical protein